jgi:multidrug resistance efflux pump
LRDRVYARPRQEQVDALTCDIDMANANLLYAQRQSNRTSQLAATGLASRQALDKATAALQTGNANLTPGGADRIGADHESIEVVVADGTRGAPGGEFALWGSNPG